MFSWLAHLYILVDEGHIDQSIDVLYDRVDDLLLAGDFGTVDNLLGIIDLDRLDSYLLIGMLSITLAAASKLPSRPEFVEKVRGRLTLLAPDRVGRLLKGLEGVPPMGT